MDAAINRFIWLLKRSGVRISPAESIDALQALAWTTPCDRETVYTVLRSTLVKDVRDSQLFDELFALYFDPLRAQASADATSAAAPSIAPPEPERVVIDTEDEGVALGSGEPLLPEAQKIQPGSLAALGQNLVLKRAQALFDQVMQQATHQVNVRRAGTATQPGGLNFADAWPTLDVDLVVNAAEQLMNDLRDLEVDEELLEQLNDQTATVITALPEVLKRYLERELALRAAQCPDSAEPIHPRHAYAFTESERREMEDIVRRLGRRLRGARSYRHVVSQRGRISIPRTLRNSLKYDGIPFQPVVTSQRDERPRIVVICDVSLSVRNTARFMLHMVYSLQALFEQVKSFVFVGDLADASQYFEQLGIDEAIATVFSGDLIDTEANSNYGQALEIFYQRHLSQVTHQTTVIILGDGRGNRNPPNAWALEEIRRRAKQLIWLSPEPRGSWGLGSSDMPLYEPICHRASVVRNLKQLGQVAEELVRRAAG